MKKAFDNFLAKAQASAMGIAVSARSSLSSKKSLKRTLMHAGNTVAIASVFMGTAIIVNQPLRAELAKSLGTSQTEMAQTSSEVNVAAVEPSMQPVAFKLEPTPEPIRPHEVLTPEVLKAPVPSIARVANQIPGKIDDKALDSSLMSSLADQQRVADFMARKYGVDPRAVRQYVSHAVVVAREVNLDPVLLVAVMAIESNFNPYAQSGAGAQGLMQVLTRVHMEKYAPYGGPAAAFKPEANIRVGAYILKSYIAQTGSLQGGLRYYVGGAVVGDGGYVGKVLREREQLVSMLKDPRANVASNSIPALATPFIGKFPLPKQPVEVTPTPSMDTIETDATGQDS